MDVTDIEPLLDRLDGEIDDIEEALQPLLTSIPEVMNNLALLDKAKLYVLVTYALESMLFSSLRLSAVDAKNHPVFTELTRVRQYFDKLKTAEEAATKPEPKPAQNLDTQAAIRFLRNNLADDKQVKTQLTEQLAKEKAKLAVRLARERAAALKGAKPSDAPVTSATKTSGLKRKAGEEEGENKGNDDDHDDQENMRNQPGLEKMEAGQESGEITEKKAETPPFKKSKSKAKRERANKEKRKEARKAANGT